MISFAISSMAVCCRWRILSAALLMISGTVLTPTVNVLGTLMRIFCRDNAFSRGILMVMGVRLM
jgi:hypothetical protein